MKSYSLYLPYNYLVLIFRRSHFVRSTLSLLFDLRKSVLLMIFKILKQGLSHLIGDGPSFFVI